MVIVMVVVDGRALMELVDRLQRVYDKLDFVKFELLIDCDAVNIDLDEAVREVADIKSELEELVC